MNPKVTVLMPVYNAEKYLREAIGSILSQTWSDFEFLIINDGSTDHSREIIRSFDDRRIRLVDNPSNIGVTKSLNRGLQMARGEFIARQDADDISYPDRLARQMIFLNQNQDVVLLGTRARAINADGKPLNIIFRFPVGSLAIRWYLMFENPFIHSSVVFQRRVICEKLGGYNETFLRTQDFELWSRLGRNYNVDNLPNILVDHRFEYGSEVSLLPIGLPLIKKLIYENLKAFLQCSSISERWADFIAGTRLNGHFREYRDWNRVLNMYEEIYSRYCRLYPEAETNKAILAHLAKSIYKVGYWSSFSSRLVSIKAFVKAQRLKLDRNPSPSIFRYFARWCLGDNLWQVCRRFNQYIDQP